MSDTLRALVVAEHASGVLKPSVSRVVTAAAQLASSVDVLVMGDSCAAVAKQAAALEGISRVLCAEKAWLKNPLAETSAHVVKGLAQGYAYILAPASTEGKNMVPRLAALLDSHAISDIIAIEGKDTFKRPIYAGNALATVQCHDPIKVLTVRTTAFAPAAESNTPADIASVDVTDIESAATFVKQALSESTRPELTSARVVISGGRGLQSSDNFKLLESLADKLGAAIGASRAAVDAGYAPNDWQVGQTGKIVAPELYMAVGISGAIQHLAGIKDAQVVVAINKDEEAPIFQFADYGLVGDLFEVLPQLVKKV
ncbi:MAG: electron transfer flavoprotein subunit alpha/FixB family protein [Alphaproteobacteria bacterium GM202ARS2]|nr:electron transfer flavoprotein subunit alpha/FixB family protein [Alphaproteobacteria bacterium GM202ARS2]